MMELEICFYRAAICLAARYGTVRYEIIEWNSFGFKHDRINITISFPTRRTVLGKNIVP